MNQNRFFIITGATGSGKTALVDELKRRGYRCVEEVARLIIQEQMSAGGDALPWENIARFKEFMLDRFIETYEQAKKLPQDVIFFDRDILDLIAYDLLMGIKPTETLQKAVAELIYNKNVFLLPPWKEIYRTDLERRQTYEEASRAYDNLVKVYKDYGRRLIEVPKVSVEKRADFVIKHVKAWMKQ